MPLRKRQVVGMHHDDVKKTLVGRRIIIRGVRSKHSLPNKGSFNRTSIFSEFGHFFVYF